MGSGSSLCVSSLVRFPSSSGVKHSVGVGGADGSIRDYSSKSLSNGSNKQWACCLALSFASSSSLSSPAPEQPARPDAITHANEMIITFIQETGTEHFLSIFPFNNFDPIPPYLPFSFPLSTFCRKTVVLVQKEAMVSC